MIPVIDISDALDGPATTSIVGAIRAAIQEVGFFQVVGHGVPQDTIAQVYAACDVLMNLPPEVKEQWTHPHPFRGWERRPSTGVETGQRLQVCGIGSPEEAIARGIPADLADYFQTNVWPDVPGLRPALEGLMDAQKRVGETVMSLFACSLDLEPDFFASCFTNQVSTFAINYYRGGVRSDDRELALGEHKDSGTLTVLHQRGEYEGLQVRMPDDSLVGVPVRPDAFVINVGELMERWTNDRFRATRHRVLLPESEGAMRTSLTLFQGPAIDTVIAPLPGCVGGEGAHYEPVTPYDWEARYFEQNGLAFGVPYGANA